MASIRPNGFSVEPAAAGPIAGSPATLNVLPDSPDPMAEPIELDLALLNGFSFDCRPDCGLCCFAGPAVTAAEAPGLIQLADASAILEGPGGLGHLREQGNGGGCLFLEEHRCRAHPVRPFPCRTFPISVHLGVRAQATLVLSCPGLAAPGLDRWARAGRGARDPVGLSGELSAVRSELGAGWVARSLETHRRKWADGDPSGLGVTALEEVRDRLRHDRPGPEEFPFPPPGPPHLADGISTLPIYFEENVGVVGIASGETGLDLWKLSERGQPPRPLGAFDPGGVPPRLTGEARRLLDRYLDYLLARDATFWIAAAGKGRRTPTGLRDRVRADLALFGSRVLVRALVRRRFRGGADDPLDPGDLLLGIEATDAEFLDRPGLGRLL